jgi:DNA-directed RNA polymerase specialized sigma24 family protein
VGLPAAIVVHARAGDQDAFATLYDIYAPRVYRFLMLRVRQPADAEDLLQRVFIKTDPGPATL